MNSSFTTQTVGDHALELRLADVCLLRYVFRPETPERESPKPYGHPIATRGGNLLTGFRPNDHPWHHALALTLTLVDGQNFWGGPTWNPDSGYTWRENHGRQVHEAWETQQTDGGRARWVERLSWRAAQGEILLRETRSLRFTLIDTDPRHPAWALRWRSTLANATDRALRLSHYHAEGLAGSNYTGLVFRGARDLLANTADTSTGIVGPAGENAAQLHGQSTPWIAMRCSHDGDPGARSTIVFVNHQPAGGAWFLRPTLPAAAFCFHHPGATALDAGSRLELEHTLIFADGDADPGALAEGEE